MKPAKPVKPVKKWQQEKADIERRLDKKIQKKTEVPAPSIFDEPEVSWVTRREVESKNEAAKHNERLMMRRNKYHWEKRCG